ncbi:MAG: hypothetical protein HZB55_01825 [Deltaproteobacteria bacterium]|nr:hypothetical protein [Deltaproteobacteria bacterium]
MRGTKSILLVASLAVGSTAVAALNPAAPGLPTVVKSSMALQPLANNGMSAMCVDCHTLQPVSAQASHWASAYANGTTHTGGSGINNANASVNRSTGEYLGLDPWVNAFNATIPGGITSKYGNSSNKHSVTVTRTPNGSADVLAKGTGYDGFELICESCHNIVLNDWGGNNLLDVEQTKATPHDGTGNIDWIGGPVSNLCVGCHGFMYTINAQNSAAPANTYYSATGRNLDGGGTQRGNNEFHWAANASGVQTAYAQNHHVMTGDNIDNVRAGAGILWTDNIVVSYTDNPIANNSAKGSYNVNKAWTHLTKSTTAGNFNCTNCHNPGHRGDLTEGGSILRYTGTGDLGGPATTSGTYPQAIQRISDRYASGGWKRFQDYKFCNQCHP